MPVMIHGKEYVTVAERVAAAHAADLISIVTEIVAMEDKQYIVKATVTRTDGRIFTGHAEEIRGSQGIAGQSPLEVAETSAVGRALGLAGFGTTEGIASADEVLSKESEQKAPRQKPSPPAAERRPNAPSSPWHTRVDLVGKAKQEIPYYNHPAHIIATLRILETEKQVIDWGSSDETCLKMLQAYAKTRADEEATP